VLVNHGGVDDVCVVGVEDEEWGERVVAYIVPSDPTRPPTLAELREFAEDQLVRAKLPKEARYVDKIPRSVSGKPRRQELVRGG
jgi:acyl-CoA synthetase (AMP-forming)/AMP-acid ligase II